MSNHHPIHDYYYNFVHKVSKLKRNVLIEKSPLIVKIAFEDIKIVSDNLLWYSEQFGEIFRVREVLDSRWYIDNDMQLEAGDVFVITSGEFKGNAILKCDCKIISGATMNRNV